jgi:hypothetical protein
MTWLKGRSLILARGWYDSSRVYPLREYRYDLFWSLYRDVNKDAGQPWHQLDTGIFREVSALCAG